jgi:arsenate reductase
MAVTIYHNPRCGKSRDTLALLEKKGIKPKVIEYLSTPPSAAELKDILKMLGLSAHELVRKKEAAAAGIVPKNLSEAALIAAMVKTPILIERPIVVAGKKAALGRPPENVLKLL